MFLMNVNLTPVSTLHPIRMGGKEWELELHPSNFKSRNSKGLVDEPPFPSIQGEKLRYIWNIRFWKGVYNWKH